MHYNKKEITTRKIFTGIILILLLMMPLSGCGGRNAGEQQEDDLKAVNKTSYLMGTLVQARVYSSSVEEGEEVLERVFDRMAEIEEKMSLNIEGSEINQVNAAAGDHRVHISEDTWIVLEKGLEYAELTAGSFDLSIGPLVKLWGIGTEDARVPSKEEIQAKLPYVNYRQIQLFPEKREVFLEDRNMLLDVGGIAKGYAADVTRQIFMEFGINHAYISIGGNVLVVGEKPDRTPWKIGIQNPFKPRGAYMAVIEVIDKTVVTSGDYERYFIKDGVTYHHILDPSTGYPACNGLKSVSIITDKSLDADALSTGMFVLGIERGLKLLEEIDGVEGIFITDDKKVYITSGLKDKLKITSNEFSLVE